MQDSYKKIFKATITMSSAQGIEAIMSLIRAKCIAVWLGPAGIAVNSILLTSLNTLFQLLSMGLFQSSVRDVSHASQKSPKEISKTVSFLSTSITLLAIIGLIFCIAGSSIMSKISFANTEEYNYDFCILGMALVFMLASNINITLFQGCNKLLFLAKTSIISAIISLLSSIPLYKFMGIRGISISIFFNFLISFILGRYYTKKMGIKTEWIPIRTVYTKFSSTIKLGIIIMISSLLINLYTYLTNVIICHIGSIEDVGFYQAAYSVTMRNFAILSAVMAADFFPRLTACMHSRKNMNETIERQCEILIISLSAVAIFLIVFSPVITIILFDSTFSTIHNLIKIFAFSFLFRSIWISLSYIALAAGDKYVYLKYDAIIGNGLIFLISIIAYYWGDLIGLAWANVIGSIMISVILFIAYRHIYGVSFTKDFYKLFFTNALLLTLLITSSLSFTGTPQLVLHIIFAILHLTYLYIELTKRIEITSWIKYHLGKNNKSI